MPKYTIRYTFSARNAMITLHEYIANTLLEPELANQYMDGVLNKIYSLEMIADCFAPHPRKFVQKRYGPDARTITYKKMTIIYNIIGDVVLIRNVIASSLILQKASEPVIYRISLQQATELRTRAKQYLSTELRRLAQLHGFHYNQVKIRKSKTRWGSCSSKGIINLSFYLMLLPSHLIEYVLLHELCHTVEMNHSAAFWSLLDSHTQGPAKSLRKELCNYYIPR